MTSDLHESFPCPHCGAELAAGARFCRTCGADDDVGWNDEDTWDGGYEDEDYDDFVRREFPEQQPVSASSHVKAVIVVITCLMLLWLALHM